MRNWKDPGEEDVQGSEIKSLIKLHERIAVQTNKILMGDDSLPARTTQGCTVLYQTDPRKGNAVENYCPITCLPLIRKLLTGVIAEEMYDYLEQEKLLPEKQKGCRRETCRTKDQLLIDKTVLKDYKKRHKNLSMEWIDYKKAYDFVPHSWITECMELFGIADKVKLFGKGYGTIEVLKIKTKCEKQNNSNKCMGIGCIQIRSRNTTVKREV